MDFSIFYKETLNDGDYVSLSEYDYYFSGFDNCDRTKHQFDKIPAKNKLWFVFPHYSKLDDIQYPQEQIYQEPSHKESEFFSNFMSNRTINSESMICIDITGFIRPHLIFLIRYLHIIGIKKIDAIYTEPMKYTDGDETRFSGFIESIESVAGYSSMNINPITDNDVLIISAGYDDDLIAKVAQHKDCKIKYLLIGFPSLQPDMYQENILKIKSIENTLGDTIIKYVPAFDPFITAQIIDSIVKDNPKITNLHLSPISTKPQVLGMALFYLYNYTNLSVDLIFPYSNTYSTKHAQGIKRTWKYTLELP